MDEATQETEVAHSVQMSFGRQNGRQQLIASIDVRCPEALSARSEMVRLLRALAFDIEAGAA